MPPPSAAGPAGRAAGHPPLVTRGAEAARPPTDPLPPASSHAEPPGSGDGRGGGGRRSVGRVTAAVGCLVLGLGLLGGAAAGSWLSDDAEARPADTVDFERARAGWHDVPVDRIFPPTLRRDGAGPGGADRRWTRVAVAPARDCAGAFDDLLARALAPVGCERLLRASYTDATSSHVTTVGVLVTRADAAGMDHLRKRFDKEGLADRKDLLPRPYAPSGTTAADFHDAQRASWRIDIRTDIPVVVYAVSGFADGRRVSEPQPADAATRDGATTAPAEAGLGHDASGVARIISAGVRRAFGEEREEAR